jgi:hypothetical protein
MVKYPPPVTLCGLLLVFASATASAEPPSLAVLDLSFDPACEELAVTAADALNAELLASKKFTLVERRRIASAVREQALGQSGVVSDESAIKVGAVLGAKLLVLGRLSRIGSLLRLDARLLDAQTARITATGRSDFTDPVNLDLAAREVVRQLTSTDSPATTAGQSTAGKKPTADATTGTGAAGVVVDPGKAQKAAAEIAQLVSRKFQHLHVHLDSVDEQGRATFNATGQFVFRGMHLSVYGVDSMTGDRELKGYMLVDDAESGVASGPTKSTAEPCARGDDAIGLPFIASVHGPSADVTKALTSALNGLPQFASDAPDATRLEVRFDLTGAAIGDRRLSVRVLDKDANVLATFDGTVPF